MDLMGTSNNPKEIICTGTPIQMRNKVTHMIKLTGLKTGACASTKI